MTRLLLTASACAALLVPVAQAQDLVAIKAGKVHTMAGPALENAVILIENGRITKIGKDLEPSWNAKVIDASDKVVMPTWVIAHTSGGMSGSNENMANVPYLTVEDAVDPSSTFYEDCLRNGIGTLHVIPGNRTLIGGRGMVIRPAGRTVEDMTVRTKGGMKLSLMASGGSRMAQIRKLRRALIDVQDYVKDYERRKAEFAKEKEAGATEKEEFEEKIDEKKKPVVELLDGKHTAYLYVPSAAEVPEALRLAEKYEFPCVFVLGQACYKAARRFARLGKPVILEETLEFYETDPETEEEKQVCTAAEFDRLGIEFALSVSGSSRASTSATRYPWWQMATCVRHGVSREKALASMTTVPAKILGLDGEIGSVEVGKVANLQILTGDPLASTSWVDTVLLEGEVVYERAKDARLKFLFGEANDASSSK